MKEQEEVEQLKEQEDVRNALKQTGSGQETASPAPAWRDRLWFGTYALAVLLLLALYYVLGSDLFPSDIRYIATLRNVLIAAVLMILTAAVAKGIRVYLIDRIESRPAQYNLTRVLHLITFLAVAIIGMSLLFNNWYTGLVSLGIFSLILGFALQRPITSLIGWIYLLIRQPYKVGDRIQIGEARGDVIDVSYLDTTLWEFGGPYLSTQHPSGRIIKFPNSLVLNETVYNYSWPLFPYVWNEIKFQVAYDSDLDFITRTMQEVVREEIGSEMAERVRAYRALLQQTPVDELQIHEHPVVHFRPSDNTWLEAIVRYVVPPKESGRIKTRLIKKLLDRLNTEPDRVLFPKSNLR